jgi:hypothetical protein
VENVCPLAEPQAPFTLEEGLLALQEALLPPLVPLHSQYQPPSSLTELATPALQRLVVGLVENVCPLAEPQAPSTLEEGLLALQEALLPPLVPLHSQYQPPSSLTEVAIPALQRLVVGLVENVCPLAEPQAPFTLEEPHCWVVG